MAWFFLLEASRSCGLRLARLTRGVVGVFWFGQLLKTAKSTYQINKKKQSLFVFIVRDRISVLKNRPK
ncbi:MAG: hypothetical protein A2934_02050 [Candidatus Sungbacteria bacterium RIFCSPLOWO2_01_FULL_47_10]|uniref:Uncharacterized protein n=1 Tax=Candidatus Sungbacteria bacterium RIFCSPLOWO2_01_FULL_47_10 TaxID=1802276 RepID=A0A1G2KXX8_9BACT|nr:MAG: hypothetical protein A2934_02050 [Candidatus Sungbacteria bacterium RIFCSPLOWO2_01_FULL_47_10]